MTQSTPHPDGPKHRAAAAHLHAAPILVTGGCGFIGSNFILDWLSSGSPKAAPKSAPQATPIHPPSPILNLDSLTYAGNPENLASIATGPRYTFVHGDIADSELLASLFRQHRPRAVVHFAAESHVDRSILGPDAFLRTNIDGTFRLLQQARAFYQSLTGTEDRELHDSFRFLHVSTDEVYGTLTPDAPAFSETTPYAPNSPYAASKASSDMLVRAWHHTYGLPTLITNCSNNYGPFQFPEKLIPLTLANALAGKPVPVYGDGQQVRDWLYVRDHCSAIRAVLARGRAGETYNIGGNNQRANLDVVRTLCGLLDELAPTSAHQPHAQLIRFVEDRPGHDRRYAIDARKIQAELDWFPQQTFETGLRRTVEWYLSNPAWVESVTSGAYQHWVQQNYAGRATAAEHPSPATEVSA